MITKSDKNIIADVLDGNIESFTLLIERYKGQVGKILSNRLPYEAVDDVSQEVFIRAFKSLKSYKGIKPFENWISRVALMACYDYFRKSYRKKEVAISGLTDDHQNWIDQCSAAESAELHSSLSRKQEAKELLVLAMNELAPADRTLIDLIYFNHYSIKEAAESFDWSIVLTKVRASRARKRLRTILERLTTAGGL